MPAQGPISFLRATAPFDELPQAAFDEAARTLEVSYFPAGTRLIERGGPPAEHLQVIRKGAVRLERDGQTLLLLEEGEIFGITSLMSGEAPLDVVVEEDALVYRIPAAIFRQLLAHGSFARHFATGLAERLKNSLERSEALSFQADLAMPVGEVVSREPVRVPPDSTVGEAARLMREIKVSSVLVESDPPGILTDRDLRNRVLAEGRGPDTPVESVLSRPLVTIPAETPVYEAWQKFLDRGYHHLPVTRGERIIGVVTATDLLRGTALGPISVLRRVERLSDRDSLPGYGAKVAEMAAALYAGGLDTAVIASFVARLNDTLVTRILRWAEADLGPPPVPYAWVAFGSEGRKEQLLLTDQDNALIYGRGSFSAHRYFPKLAERVVEDLVAAGFPRCPGGYMANQWQGSLEDWESRFRLWFFEPKAKALLHAHIFFDFRKVHGELELDPLHALMGRAAQERTFLSALAKAALEFRPRTGFLLRLKGEASHVDFKLHGISPIVFLARCYALEARATSRNTLERLQAAADAGIMEKDVLATLTEAYRFFLRVRLREQLRMIDGGERPSNAIELSQLSALERRRLKDAFSAILDWQQMAAYHYRTDVF